MKQKNGVKSEKKSKPRKKEISGSHKWLVKSIYVCSNGVGTYDDDRHGHGKIGNFLIGNFLAMIKCHNFNFKASIMFMFCKISFCSLESI